MLSDNPIPSWRALSSTVTLPLPHLEELRNSLDTDKQTHTDTLPITHKTAVLLTLA